jgi:phosphatidylserine/phosphatidylglycerophosphate/cardiolipin synthase-like enzyme
MREMTSNGPLHVHAIPGTHVVTFGFDWPEDRANELQGFAIHRTNHTTREAAWLKAQKRYLSTDPGTAKGERVSTLHHPVQSFLWADYTVEPDTSYTYRIVARGGVPNALVSLSEVDLTIHTIGRSASGHAVHFNRGAIAAQEYARRFNNKAPEDVANGAAYQWLSRGLFESFEHFIERAQSGDSLHVAIYEARYAPALAALTQARARGVDIQVIVDAKENGDEDEAAFPRDENLAQLEAAGLADVAHLRATNPSYIAHNKFVVLSTQGVAREVWTGSTNWSENGFFGHLNVGHEIRDDEVARRFLEYWTLLKADPKASTMGEGLSELFSIPDVWPEGCSPVFSPRSSRDALDSYIKAASESQVVLVTLAFSIDSYLGEVLASDSPGLRFVLMDGIKGNSKQIEKMSATVRNIRKTEAGRVAIGAYLRGNALDQFLLERSRQLGTHVQFVHTKFMLADPLGPAPLVISGSANFSEASCTRNDENMLVIAADPEVTDIYLGEFMRSYSHYAFRDAANAARKEGREFRPKSLNEDRTWASAYYGDGFHSRQRRYFAHGRL